MSLSKHMSEMRLTGKVLMGMDSPGPDEMTIQEIEGKRKLLWDDSINEEYLERVKTKAREAAKEIKILAELEAEALRATSRHEGYQDGLAQAQADVDAHTRAMSAEVENLLAQIGAQGKTIFEERRRDVISLIRLAVKKAIAVEMSDQHAASLENLMREALEKLDAQRQLVIKCCQEDAEDLRAFIGSIQEQNPSLKYWTVKGDPSLSQGGILVEGEECKVDNSVAGRWKGVEPILDRLVEQVTSGDEG
ncbi:MAG: FliH/SctL family protein [Pseudodesulfovibrio sp.]